MLFDPETADRGQIKQACYEIRIGSRATAFTTNSDGYEVKTELPESDQYVIHPGETVLLYSLEKFIIPLNVLARVNVLGQYFQHGLIGGNTYVDPGFANFLYIALTNSSNRSVRLNKGKPIAKVEFYKLGSEVKQGHSGSPRELTIEKFDYQHELNTVDERVLIGIIKDKCKSEYEKSAALTELVLRDRKTSRSNILVLFTLTIIFFFYSALSLTDIKDFLFLIAPEVSPVIQLLPDSGITLLVLCCLTVIVMVSKKWINYHIVKPILKILDVWKN